MSLLSVSSKLPRRLGIISSCSQLLSSIRVVHFRAPTNFDYSNPNYNIPHSTHIPDSHLDLQQLLTQNKSGFENLDLALSLFRKMLKMRPLPCDFHFTQLLTALVKMKHYPVAVSLFSDMCTLGIPVDVVTFNIAINCCCHSNRVDYAFSLLAGIFKRQAIERGEYPDIVTYNTLMHGYCSQGQMDEALALLNTIRNEKIVPDCYTYNILLDAYCKELKLDIAMDLYRKMSSEGLSPTVVTHNVLLHGLCKLGKSVEALTFFYKIQNLGHKPNNVTYHTILDGLFKNQYVNKALSLFRTMKCNGLVPDRDTYNIIIRGCLRNDKYNEACKLVDKMFDCGFSADSFTTSLLQHLLLLEQDPTLLSMHQKCLHRGFTALY